MEKKDAIFVLVLLGAAGYGIHANWDTIKLKLGLDDLNPGRIKAVELARKANGLEQYRTNWEVLKDRQQGGDIEVTGDPWSAEPMDETKFRVVCSFRENGEPVHYVWIVDTASSSVSYLGEGPPNPSPR